VFVTRVLVPLTSVGSNPLPFSSPPSALMYFRIAIFMAGLMDKGIPVAVWPGWRTGIPCSKASGRLALPRHLPKGLVFSSWASHSNLHIKSQLGSLT
jgi:hypothetical protein